MAFKPSRRKHKLHATVDLELTPIMNLFVALLPFLLLAAVFSKIAILELYLPTEANNTTINNGKNNEEDLTLTVAITKSGFSVSGFESSAKSIIIPLKGKQYDYKELSLTLKKIKDRYHLDEGIVLLIEPQIEYDAIIHTMDASREIDIIERGNKTKQILFPTVSLADAVILEEGQK